MEYSNPTGVEVKWSTFKVPSNSQNNARYNQPRTHESCSNDVVIYYCGNNVVII
jgi:hypothetical protein